MVTEGYPPEQIKKIVENVDIDNQRRLQMVQKRWKMYSDPEKRIQIKAFDHFSMAIKMRKMLKYWLSFSNNRVTPIKSDL